MSDQLLLQTLTEGTGSGYDPSRLRYQRVPGNEDAAVTRKGAEAQGDTEGLVRQSPEIKQKAILCSGRQSIARIANLTYWVYAQARFSTVFRW